MGIGTDAIVELMAHYPGMYFDEMEYFVRLGRIANGDDLGGHQEWRHHTRPREGLGDLEKGKLADLQVVDGNPLESFQPLSHPTLVMIGGSMLRRGGVEPR